MNDGREMGSTYIQRPVICKERRIVALPANTRAANRAKRVRDPVRSEVIGRHLVLAGVPLDL